MVSELVKFPKNIRQALLCAIVRIPTQNLGLQPEKCSRPHPCLRKDTMRAPNPMFSLGKFEIICQKLIAIGNKRHGQTLYVFTTMCVNDVI